MEEEDDDRRLEGAERTLREGELELGLEALGFELDGRRLEADGGGDDGRDGAEEGLDAAGPWRVGAADLDEGVGAAGLEEGDATPRIPSNTRRTIGTRGAPAAGASRVERDTSRALGGADGLVALGELGRGADGLRTADPRFTWLEGDRRS